METHVFAQRGFALARRGAGNGVGEVLALAEASPVSEKRHGERWLWTLDVDPRREQNAGAAAALFDARLDNETIWLADYCREHYRREDKGIRHYEASLEAVRVVEYGPEDTVIEVELFTSRPPERRPP